MRSPSDGITTGPLSACGSLSIISAASTNPSAVRLPWKQELRITFGVCGNCWRRLDWPLSAVAETTINYQAAPCRL